MEEEGGGQTAGRSWPLRAPSHQRLGSGFLQLQRAGRLGSSGMPLSTREKGDSFFLPFGPMRPIIKYSLLPSL